MRNLRCYYTTNIHDFLNEPENGILGKIHSNCCNHNTLLSQSNAWKEEIIILKQQLAGLEEGKIFFEYIIPRMGKRVDVVILHNNIIFLLEFKCGEKEYKQSACDQVEDYALDLQNFHEVSHDKLLIPIVVATNAIDNKFSLEIKNNIAKPLKCNSFNIRQTIQKITSQFNPDQFDYEYWENSKYMPTPTIIEAAQALYQGHNVDDITRSDADANNLSSTLEAVNKIIKFSKENHRKAICFITGVPGAGKTLVGLDLAIQHTDLSAGKSAVFLSGNMPLVNVLQEALARDRVFQSKQNSIKLSKKEALREAKTFIQIIHRYRDNYLRDKGIPLENIAIFDEAQRAWTNSKMKDFMKVKKGIIDFNYSEPEFLISTMDRHKDWAVIVCLIGGGQEINNGEAGMPEWFESLRRSFLNWDVYLTTQLKDKEYIRDYKWDNLLSGLNAVEIPDLHLSTSIRSFRTPDLADFVKALLDCDGLKAKSIYDKIKDKYPIKLTRNLNEAKDWIKNISRGSARFGILASSGAARLKAEGLFVKNKISVENWFLNDKTDVRSSYSLEDVVSEFDIQGLEVDYSIVAWDIDLRFEENNWSHYKFSGNNWCQVKNKDAKLYLKNAYRVLLTRARQGMIIYVPEGNDYDRTRLSKYYDGIYNYLKSILGTN